jgi:predicted ester cyclase
METYAEGDSGALLACLAYVRFTLVHSGRYHDLEPTGRQVELWEMIFHRFENDLIAESWRMTYPDGMYAALTDR